MGIAVFCDCLYRITRNALKLRQSLSRPAGETPALSAGVFCPSTVSQRVMRAPYERFTGHSVVVSWPASALPNKAV
jgi:hypothetical protein